MTLTLRVPVAIFSTVAAVVLTSAHLTAQASLMEMRGAGFALRSETSGATLSAVACDLETAVKVLRPSTTGSEVPKVVAVDSARGMREWLPQFKDRRRGNPLGAYWHGLYGDHIVIRVDAPAAERRRRVLHEYAHFVTHFAHPEPAPWLDEGVSEVWEHAAITKDGIEIGGPVAEHLKRLRSQKNWIPVRELLSANIIPTNTDSAAAVFYAESWALAHYLMFEKHSGALVLHPVPEPADIPTDAVLRAYVRGPMAPPVTISTALGSAVCPAQVTRRQMPELAVMLDRAQALADGERPTAALPLLQAALGLKRDDVEALETIGFVYFRENRPAEAAAVFDRVIGTGKASYISYYYRATLAAPIPGRGDGAGRVSEVEYLRKTLALNPGFAPAVKRLQELLGG